MDVSFTNVLEGARQYFQGLPVPSTGGATATADHNLATSTSSASPTSSSHEHGAASSVASPSPAPPAPPAPPPLSLPSQSTSNSIGGGGTGSTGDQESSRYLNDVRPPSVDNAATSSSSFWSPSVEPYPPQPTRVEVPDTRPGDEGSSMDASSSSSSIITLTEMQPSSRSSSASNFSQKQSNTTSSLPNDLHRTNTSSPHLHQLQPPQQARSPGPVYQQLNPVTRTSFSTAEILASTHQSTYQTANDRQPQPSAPVVAQRTQYYPRYHHPDITKSAPVPFSQNSIYQSSNVTAATSLSNVQSVTRPTPIEQSNANSSSGSSQGHTPEQRVPPSSYGNNAAPPPPVTIYGTPSPQSYASVAPTQHQLQNRLGSSSSNQDRTSHPERSHNPRVVSSSPSCPSVNPCPSPRHSSGNLSHIPPSSSSSSSSTYQNLPAHIPTSHLASANAMIPPQHHHAQQPQQQSPMQQQQHSSRINASQVPSSYTGRMMHGGASATSSNANQMPPPPALTGYHPVASPHDVPHHATPSPHRQSPHVSTLHNPHVSSPHHTPSPHANFQPHSPTYPPPPPPTSTPHSYNLPITSQHYQPSVGGYAANPYGLPPQSSYHSYQKTQQPSYTQASYYQQQPNRSQSQPYVQQIPIPGAPQSICSGTGSTNGTVYQQSKPVTYNGADSKRNSIEMPYGSYRPPQALPRTGSTHNLPPIAPLSSYHSNRRESASKAQSVQRQRYSANAANKVPATAPPVAPMAAPQRVPEYPVLPIVNHATPVNGRTTAVTNSSYSRYTAQHGYPTYATTMAPSHQGTNSSSSTTVTSISVTPSRPSATTIHDYQASEANRTGSSYHHQPVRSTEDYGYKEYPYQTSTAPTIQSTASSLVTTPSPQTNGVRKRESPLDLSVKTVKTSADSTAQDDIEITTEKHVSSSTVISSRSNSNPRTMLPPMQPSPQPAPYPAYDNRLSSNGNRNLPPGGSIRASTPQTVCAPKVDFLPDFNSTPLRHQQHENTLQRRSSTQQQQPHQQQQQQQQLYAPPPQSPSSQHPNNTTAPLPHMSTFKKTSLPTSQMYDSITAPAPPPALSSSYLAANDTSRSGRYPPMMHPGRIAPTVPIHDYPSDPSKYYLDSRSKFGQPAPRRDRTPTKRPGETIYGISLPKQPRLNTWIRQKLSTAKALDEQQKMQERNSAVSVPLPNGNLVAPNAYEPRLDSGYPPSESARYQPQAYCDKRSYAEPKVTNSSPAYAHSGITKPANIHSLPQATNINQQSYPNYRPSQKPPLASGATSGGQPPVEPPINTGADKRVVLSLLRNSLENKQQREEQMNSQQPILANHSQQSFQNKVVAPVEPKTNIGRHNLSPFTAASLLERNSNTPPHYKFHVPRAVDSITQEAPRSLYGSRVNSSATLPGKEALLGPRGAENQIHRDKDDGLAAKIRTKAELKQVGTGQFAAKPTVIRSQDTSTTPKELDSAASTSTPQSGSSAGSSPPKLTREKVACLPPRRRLFSRTEEENMPVAATVPAPAPAPAIASSVPARASGFRSSSETSVFDFRESDTEDEMPVLERQTLEEMRRDRKQLSKVQPPVSLNDAMYMDMTSSSDLVKIELKENDKIHEVDAFWSTTCDKFMEQLRTGDAMKKRGRKKKISCTITSKFEDNDSIKELNANTSQIKPEDIKKEVQDDSLLDAKDDYPETSKDDETSMLKEIKVEVKMEPESKDEEKNSSDEELPLIRRAKKKMKKDDSDCEEEIICRKRRVRRGSRIKLESSSGSESSSEESDISTEFGHGSSVADRLRARKRCGNNSVELERMKLRSRDTTPQKSKAEKESKSSTSKSSSTSQKGKPKPLFGDGSDFRPGWEEEVYVYKKSLRMPPRLITVSKPSRFHRLSTSLPDLDPGSPALSVSMDSSDVCLSRKKLEDSDVESNYSFTTTGIGIGSKIDDEEATSSTTISCPVKGMKHSKSEGSSIVDVLAQKVGTNKKEQKRKQKEKLDKSGNKILQKGSNEPELLPTPSLTPLLETSKLQKGKSPIKDSKTIKPVKIADSFLLGYFRKETVNNFRDTFKNNHVLPNEFSTFVLKSRTRTETRVLKKQATIREVFGEDRPASAPPMQNHDDTSQDDDSQNETPENTLSKDRTLKQKVVSRLKNACILRSRKAIMNSKHHLLLKRRKDLLKSLAEKKLQRLKTEAEEEPVQEETNDTQEAENNELDDETNESEVRNKKKLKLRTSRRKFRSGFDYIRKKKKPLKKDETLPKERKRHVLTRPNPECVADIQTEIRTWVIKKGVGETMLHRAARLGYTDVTAYCLEKLNNAPSPKDNAGYTPLHEACSKGHLEIAKLLLAYGANVSESANGGIRPLHEAAENGATELVRLLLSYGADPLLATYSGQTPLMLAADTDAYSILEQHLDDIQGRASTPWSFGGPASIFDPEETGYNPMENPPMDSPEPELDEIDMDECDVNLPVLFTLINDSDKWVLLQDLMTALRIKSKEALLRQVNPKAHSGPPAIAHRDVMRELKLQDFLEQSRCCHLLSGGERINMRGSKVTLIKYNDKVRSLLNVEKVVISLR
ncbi:mucin-17 [Ceratina calcarata]|uniref:Mucin-17 n=1 Tax=Ceratina calcarata TaxID=156304 RepID=A0AAJ7NCF6_9HYME|nr:mucin-17 [Ceratina calcarata]XP_017888468.1 mucin-17 [Ceratina calcarata]XP_017888469.1 mucin-17 [Ceratina calcarata]XP_017888470.1 mucin-17 [Ceratina calcarata]XP_017888471.1 mucin-17 [Ceratina calcarata]